MTGAKVLNSSLAWSDGPGIRIGKIPEGLGGSNVQCQLITMLLAVCLLLVGFSVVPTSAQTERSPVAPDRERVEASVREAYDKFRSDTGGKNADYIPYL